MDSALKKEKAGFLKKLKTNPLSRIEMLFNQRKTRKQQKELQLQLAILSGGIKRMK